jgi:hypothetical protein
MLSKAFLLGADPIRSKTNVLYFRLDAIIAKKYIKQELHHF